MSCKTCKRACRDVSFTTFLESDGRHSTCADLKRSCRGQDESERVWRLCPVTCGMCSGLIAGPEDRVLAITHNHSEALRQALLRGEGLPKLLRPPLLPRPPGQPV